jgi:hypothetical protein
MESPASSSLDREASGFEKMESSINPSAIHFAMFGRMYLNNHDSNREQLIIISVK